MKIIHLSDTHLGYQAFDAVSADGINAREEDIYSAFERVITRIIALKPDLVLHSGDFFHRPSPSNRALTQGLEQLRRLAKAAIPIVIIAGNHETPKTIYNSPILRALRTLDHCHPVFGDSVECFEFEHVAVHGVPHINDSARQREELAALRPIAGKSNILMLHTSLGKRYLMEEYGEQVFPPEFEVGLQGFQYVALGHWHNMQQLRLHPNAWYSGSIERLSETEATSEKGFLLLDVPESGELKVSFEPCPARPWLILKIVQCHQKSVSEIWTEIEAFQAVSVLDGAIMSLSLEDIKPAQSFEFSNILLREKFAACLHFSIHRKVYSERAQSREMDFRQFESLDKMFEDYLASKLPDQASLAQTLGKKATEYFQRTLK
jgi:DNA repair protein SbcD/Mre11